MMKLTSAFVLCFLILVSCTGPVYVAKSSDEGIRASYLDPRMNELASQNQAALREIYRRFELARIDIYPNGIGFTALTDDQGRKHYYLLVDVRPRDINFGEGQTTANERFNEVIQRHFEKNLRLVTEGDLNMNGIEGLAFSVHWPVRDFSQCDSHGGFLEYAMIYFTKSDFSNIMEGRSTFLDAIKDAEVITSLGMKQATAVRVVEGK